MRNCQPFRVPGILAILFALALSSSAWAAGSDDDKEAKEKFQSLEKQVRKELPGIVAGCEWFHAAVFPLGTFRPDGEVELMRRIGPKEAYVARLPKAHSAQQPSLRLLKGAVAQQ